MEEEKAFEIQWYGTVFGTSIAYGKTIEEAIENAKIEDSAIELEDLPGDWTIDEEVTKENNQEVYTD